MSENCITLIKPGKVVRQHYDDFFEFAWWGGGLFHIKNNSKTPFPFYLCGYFMKQVANCRTTKNVSIFLKASEIFPINFLLTSLLYEFEKKKFKANWKESWWVVLLHNLLLTKLRHRFTVGFCAKAVFRHLKFLCKFLGSVWSSGTNFKLSWRYESLKKRAENFNSFKRHTYQRKKIRVLHNFMMHSIASTPWDACNSWRKSSNSISFKHWRNVRFFDKFWNKK